MFRSVFFMVLLIAPFVTFAQPMPQYGDRQERQEPKWHVDRVPNWCRNYDRHMYYRELRACGDDRYCRRDVRRKGERCGIQ